MSDQPRLHLAPPDIGANDQRFVAEALASNWVAPAGPHLAAFEREMCAASGARAAVASISVSESLPEPAEGEGTRWLTCLLVNPDAGGLSRDAVLEAGNTEAWPLWKPLHRQPLYGDAEPVGGAVAEDLFARGLCLLSGSSMTEEELQRVVRIVRRAFGRD